MVLIIIIIGNSASRRSVIDYARYMAELVMVTTAGGNSDSHGSGDGGVVVMMIHAVSRPLSSQNGM